MPHSVRTSASSNGDLVPPIPLIDLSRSPSPYPRSRSAVQSEDEDDEYEPSSSIRPLVRDSDNGRRKGLFRNGGLGHFFFGTWLGWQIYVGLLVLWMGGCAFGWLVMDRLIMLSGVWKFPWPLTTAYLQLVIAHVLLVFSASLTRGLVKPLNRLGLGAMVAPSLPALTPDSNFRPPRIGGSFWSAVYRWMTSGSGGIAGGGLFEFEGRAAKKALPLALLYLGNVVFSKLAFSWVGMPYYQMSRIGIVPLSLLFTAFLSDPPETHSVPALSAALTATINLFIASSFPEGKAPWDGVLLGVISSFFAALYPLSLLRTYKSFVADLVPHSSTSDPFFTGYPSAPEDTPSTREETRAYYRTLHYTSLLAILIFTPLLLLSGEATEAFVNCYVLDEPFLWFLTLCGGIGCWAVFVATLLLAKATSPLTVNFLDVPRNAFQLIVLSWSGIPVHSWVGILVCWAGSAWFLVAKRGEGRRLDRLRLETGRG